jgi:hypothetical protein
LADLLARVDLRPAQVGFILMLGGFVVYEILSEWPASYEIMMWAPDRVTRALGVGGSTSSLVSATVLFVVGPVSALLIVAALAKLASGRERVSLRVTARTFALLLLPTIAGAHIIKSLLRMSSRIPYWRGVFSDPQGIETARRMVAGTLVPDESVTAALDPVVSVAAVALLLASLAATALVFRRTVAGRKLGPGVGVVLFVSALVYWSLFGVTIFQWRF